MKRIFNIAVLALVIVLGSSLRNTVSAQYDDQYSNDQYNQGDRDVNYQTFYDELSPHGRWIDYPNVGYVWVPDAGPDFRPYSSNGHWVYSDNYEWLWVSDYDWGWAPFHYGRWDQDPSYGWYWVPGYEWSPAWVAWRDGGDYYGWAPIRPGINISINFNIGGYSPPNDFWCFAPRRYITSPRIYDYCVDRRQNISIINFTTVIVNNYHYGNNYGFRSGPRRYDAERYCGTINPVRFRESNRPGRPDFRNNQVSIYRPNVRRDDNRSFTPRTVERYDRNGGFRNNNDTRRDVTTRNNNGNPGVDRRDGTNGQPGNNGNNDRRFERRNDNTGTTNTPPIRQPDTRRVNDNNPGNRNGDTRVFNPSQTPDRNPNPGNNGNNDRRFERRNDNTPTSTPPVRQPDTRVNDNTNRGNRNSDTRVFNPSQIPDRNPSPGNNGNTDRRFERKNDNTPTNTPPVRQPQMERKQEQRQQPVERRQEQQPQVERRQEQPRQMERRDEGNKQPTNNGGNSDNRSGRRRF